MKTRIAILTVLLALTAFCQPTKKQPTPPKYWPLEISGMIFTKMELALNDASREKGLMYRTELPEDGGMLFLFKKEKYQSFWMKNTMIPLDIIYVNKKGIVTAVHTMDVMKRRPGESDENYSRRLKSYPSKQPAIAAIELNAGMAEALGITAGTKININGEKLSQFVK